MKRLTLFMILCILFITACETRDAFTFKNTSEAFDVFKLVLTNTKEELITQQNDLRYKVIQDITDWGNSKTLEEYDRTVAEKITQYQPVFNSVDAQKELKNYVIAARNRNKILFNEKKALANEAIRNQQRQQQENYTLFVNDLGLMSQTPKIGDIDAFKRKIDETYKNKKISDFHYKVLQQNIIFETDRRKSEK